MNIRRRRLMRALVHYRSEAGLSMEEAAERSLCGIGTVHRMENGLNAVPLRVKTLLELYEAPPEIVLEMVQLAKEKDKAGIVRHYRGIISKRFAEYLDLEVDATELSLFQADMVHGLLTTEDYARAIISASAFNPAPSEVDRLVELRMNRQRRLTEDNPPELVAVLGEAALHARIGGTQVLKAQLEHLLQIGMQPNVTIQVLPFSAGAHPAIGSSFTLLGFPDHADPDVVFTETLVGFSILEDAEDVRPVKLAFSRVLGVALSPHQSAQLLSNAVADLSQS